MRHLEEDLQQLLVRHLGRIEPDPHGFGVSGRAAADLFVLCGRGVTAGITRLDLGDALDVLEHGIDAPRNNHS